MPNTWYNRILYHILLVTVSLLATEAVVRVVRPQPQLVRSYIGIDPDLGPISKPHISYYDTKGREKWGYKYHVHTNNLGLRMNRDVKGDSPAREVLFLGNSIVFGWGNELEDSFYGRLQQQLKGQNILLMNGGYGTYSTGHCRKLVQRLAKKNVVADLVYFLSLGDMHNNIRRDPDYRVYDYRIGPARTVEFRPVQVFPAWKRWLYLHTPYNWLNQNSHAFTFMKEFVKEAGNSAGEALARAGNMSSVAEDTEPKPENSEREKSGKAPPPDKRGTEPRPADQEIRVEYSGSWSRKELEEAWLVTRGHLRAMREFCAEHNKQFLIVWLPASDEFKTGRGKPEAEMLKERLSDEFGDAFIDPAAECVAKSNDYTPDALFFGDGHWTPLANRIYANAIRSRIVDRLGGVHCVRFRSSAYQSGAGGR